MTGVDRKRGNSNTSPAIWSACHPTIFPQLPHRHSAVRLLSSLQPPPRQGIGGEIAGIEGDDLL